MASRQTPSPHKLPNAPADYNVSFFNQFNRQIEKILNELNQPDLAKSGGLYIDVESLPSSGYNLRPGMVFRDGAILKIVLVGAIYLPTLSTSVQLGTLTVSV